MKTNRMFKFTPAALTLLTCCRLAAAQGGKPTTPPPSPNLVPEVAVPQSVFSIDDKTAKDPFFPNSTRIKVVAPITAPVVSASLFTLNGLAGTSENPLIMINNRTMGPNEDAEVNTVAGRKKIHCVQINPATSSATITVAGMTETIELHLHK
jgi:hypothetical protein